MLKVKKNFWPLKVDVRPRSYFIFYWFFSLIRENIEIFHNPPVRNTAPGEALLIWRHLLIHLKIDIPRCTIVRDYSLGKLLLGVFFTHRRVNFLKSTRWFRIFSDVYIYLVTSYKMHTSRKGKMHAFQFLEIIWNCN